MSNLDSPVWAGNEGELLRERLKQQGWYVIHSFEKELTFHSFPFWLLEHAM